MSTLDWGLPALRQALGPGVELEWLARCGSTNTELLERARAGLARPCVLVAEQQDAGRGRLGRQWQSWPGASLTVSIAWPWGTAPLEGLSLAVGAALAEALDARVQLKWPNDLWFERRKLGGILIETVAQGGSPRALVLGVGLNIAPPPADVGLPSAGLQQLDPRWSAPTALATAAPVLVDLLQGWQGFAPWQARYAARDALRGLPLELSGVQGLGEGVSRSGELLLRDAQGQLHALASGEAQLRWGSPS
ncbi:biotin--[acetyl-CoA-carboxylase] ligase [Inhella sp.]|uniref:biotin--[acetyl-CoA-carboxylase] ligase n=1 Tax=Inhella sp. TaxID=1921806 RepID=UPI0035B4B94A